VQALLDGGTEITDAAKFADLQYAPPSSTNPLCVSPAQLPTELSGPYTSTKVGQLGRANFQGQTGEQTLFFVPTGQRTLTATDPEVVDAARQELEQAAQSAANEAQTANQAAIARAYRKILRETDVDVDPRFGRLAANGAVEAPITPLIPRSATTTTTPATAAGT
jgi:hypothetical protein